MKCPICNGDGKETREFRNHLKKIQIKNTIYWFKVFLNWISKIYNKNQDA